MLPIHHRLLKTVLLLAGLGSSAVAQVATTSAASYGPIVAPDSIASAFGINFASATTATSGIPLPITLGNTQVFVTDSAGAKSVVSLYLVSASQINFLVPATAALGKGTITVTTAGTSLTGDILISNVAPAIFGADGSGQGAAAAQSVRVTAGGTATVAYTFTSSPSGSTATPINLQSTDKVYLMLYGTGIRRHSLNPVKATVGGISVPVLYAGPQSQYPGLDQVNLGPLPLTLQGKGKVDIVLIVDGIPTKPVQVAFQ